MNKKKLPVENYIGCLVGGAVGDALGAPIEFLNISEIRKLYGKSGIKDYIECPDGSGEFTDDTQMTLFTAEGILRAYHRAMTRGIGGAESTIVYHAYLRWLYTQGLKIPLDNIKDGVYDLKHGWLIKRKELFIRRAPGNTCLNALASGIIGSINQPINNSKGCGGVMRVAPVGLMLYDRMDLAFKYGAEIAAITHGHSSGFLSAGCFSAIISGLTKGKNLNESIEESKKILITYDNHEETLNAVNQALALYDETKILKNLNLCNQPEMNSKLGEGWVGEEALSISLYSSLVYEKNYIEGVLMSVNHSGDSDSTGSITGNILGLINGIESIPEYWIRKLKYCNIVKQIAKDLRIKVIGTEFKPDEGWHKKYPIY